VRLVVVLAIAACGSPRATPDAALDATDTSAGCAATFGTGLTDAFGRFDGTLIAIVEPGNTHCAAPNSTHVILEISDGTDAYRMVVNVLSTSADPHVWLGATDAPLVGQAWAEGWHPDQQLDYVATLGVAKNQFTQADEPTAVARLEQMLAIGAHISVFATSSGEHDSTHLVHRNVANQDGAIVLDPESAPHYLLTAFPEQVF
jgi:hypothetical protein